MIGVPSGVIADGMGVGLNGTALEASISSCGTWGNGSGAEGGGGDIGSCGKRREALQRQETSLELKGEEETQGPSGRQEKHYNVKRCLGVRGKWDYI